MVDGTASGKTHLKGILFEDVHRERVFDDAKRFADSVPLDNPDTVLQRYEEVKSQRAVELRGFIDDNFHVPDDITIASAREGTGTITEYIAELWQHLRRSQNRLNEFDTLIPLPNSHVVPGGRFREGYYWDSYFIAEGMAAAGRYDIIKDMIENFAHLIDRFGYVPNGNRRYYLGRSQFPMFCKMVELLGESEETVDPIDYAPALTEEYRFWMDGVGPDEADEVGNRVVPLEGAVLNRYWDENATPRPEAFHADRQLAEPLPNIDRERLYRDIRAACESGWDFSSRWLSDSDELRSIRTTDLIPIDLNASLWYTEKRLAEWSERTDQPEKASRYREAARRRREALMSCCWDESSEFFFDYDLDRETCSDRWTLAGVSPLFFGFATDEQAAAVAETIESRFLKPGGLVTTLTYSDQQWDAPNGWAPLQWMAVRGLRQYGFGDLADRIKSCWLEMTRSVFDRHRQLVEKYDVIQPKRKAVDGEYPVQLGFGWTNAVVIALEAEPRIDRIDRPGDELTPGDDSIRV